MHIMIIAQHYAPEEVSGAVLATELAEDLVKLGHQVTFVTCAPNYPNGKIFSGYQNSFFRKEVMNGVNVIRVWSYISPTKTFWRRIINYGTFSISVLWCGLFAGGCDVIMSYSPPLPLGISAWLLSKIKRVKWVLRVEDLFPEAAVAAGVLKKQGVIKFMEGLEKFLYKQADYLSLISEGFRKNISNKGISSEKLTVAPLWADSDQIRPMRKDNRIRTKYRLHNKFVVLYAGALGHTSALEDVAEAASYLKENTSIYFVIVGEGVKKEDLKGLCQQHELDNFLFLPYQPREEYAELLAAADVSLVTLNPKSANFSLPNKIFNIMSSGRPVLAVSPENCEISNMIKSWDCGINIPNGYPDKLAAVIESLASNYQLLENLGRNGRTVIERYYSRDICVRIYEKTLIEASL